jgi:type IV pilus assembly protein PilW
MTPCRGFSLVELMIALAIGSVILGGLVAIHGQSRRLAGQVESMAELSDAGRFALSYVAADLQHAGYYGLVGRPELIDGAAGPDDPVAIPVSGDCGRNWSTSLHLAVDGLNNHYNLDCRAYGGSARAGSDVLVVRHVSGRTSNPESGRLQVHSGPGSGLLNHTGSAPAIETVETRDLIVVAYYVSPVSSAGKQTTSLRRKILRAGPRIVDEEIIPGVDDFQIQFGLVSETAEPSGENSSMIWVNPENLTLSAQGSTVVAVRLWLLLSSDDVAMEYHAPIAPYADQASPPADERRRMLITRTFSIRNGGS